MKREKHGMFKTRVYRIWKSMRNRCNNKNYSRYKYYGGRGIRVCESWNNFTNFFNDMGHPPTDMHSIDRLNNNGDYEPNNCRWATIQEQANNRSTNYNIAYLGLIYTVAEWSRKLNIHRNELIRMLLQGYDLRGIIRELDLQGAQKCLDLRH